MEITIEFPDVLSPREEGHKAALAAMKRREKIRRNPLRATPSDATMKAHAAHWNEFMGGWLDALKERKAASVAGWD